MGTQQVLEARNGQMLAPLKWKSRYSNQQRILNVGEGDFSFTSCLATTFGAATNMVATSLDSRGALLQKYGMEAEFNTFNLSQRGALVFHDFDACKMAMSQQRNLLCASQMSYFDRIIFNFPHAGFLGREDDAHLMKKHKKLVRLFFANARDMLLPGGQVHVSHKLGYPYEKWMLEEQAQVSGLRLVERVPFHREHYPGYRNCRGDGSSAGESFYLGQADTYIFAARAEEPSASILNVGEPLRMSSTLLYRLKSLKKKAVRKARASQVTPLLQVVADEVTRLEKQPLGKKKMNTLENLKLALQQMNLENYPASLSCTTDEPPTPTLNVGEPVGMSSTITMLAHVKSLKEKAVCKAGVSEETSLQQVVANEVIRLEKLPFGKKKMKTLKILKSALQQMNLENYPTSLSCTTKEPPASTLNVCEPVGMSITMTKLKRVVRKAGASQETSLKQVLADEVTGLEKPQLGKKKMKTLETPKPALQQMNLSNCQGPLEALAEDLGGSLEEHAKIIEMDMASLSKSTNVKCNSQNIGCSESTLPPFSPQTKLEDMDLVSHVNPNEALVFGREETSKSHLTLDSSLELSQRSGGTISTIEKIEEEIKEDCTSSKQKSPLLEIQLVAPLQRNVSCTAVDQHVNSVLIVGDHVGMSSTMLAHLKSLKEKAIRNARASQVTPLHEVVADEVARLEKLKEEKKLGKKKMKTLETLKSALTQMNLENIQFTKASMEGRAEDIGIVLDEENGGIIDMDMAVCASLSNAADIEWGSQSSGCTKSLSSESVDLLFPVNPGNEVFEKTEDTTKPHDNLEPSPQFSKVSAETISTVDKVEEDIIVNCPSTKQESHVLGIQLMDDLAALQRKQDNSDLEESSGLNEESVGCLTVLPNLWEVLWRHLQRI